MTDDELRAFIAEQLAWLRKGCPRCDWIAWYMPGTTRCSLCGMDPREHGPAPRRQLKGITNRA